LIGSIEAIIKFSIFFVIVLRAHLLFSVSYCTQILNVYSIRNVFVLIDVQNVSHVMWYETRSYSHIPCLKLLTIEEAIWVLLVGGITVIIQLEGDECNINIVYFS
jgi:hypothetical protein